MSCHWGEESVPRWRSEAPRGRLDRLGCGPDHRGDLLVSGCRGEGCATITLPKTRGHQEVIFP